MSKINILFVCLGNICRSPAAEAVFKNYISDLDEQDSFHIDSAGTSGHHQGEMADTRMRKVALERKINITSTSRKITKEDFEKFDFIIVMDNRNYEEVSLLVSTEEDQRKIVKIGDFFDPRYSNFSEVPDPYYNELDGFKLVLDLLESANTKLYDFLKNK